MTSRGILLLLDFAEDEAEAAEIDARVADTYEMVQQSIEGKIAEGYPPKTNVKSPPPKQ